MGDLFLVAADEVFTGLDPQEGRSFLKENRAGLGYRVSPRATVEIACLRQTQTAGVADVDLARNAVQVNVAVATANHVALVRR